MERDQAFSNMRREKVFFQTSEDLKNSFPIDGLSNGMFLDWLVTGIRGRAFPILKVQVENLKNSKSPIWKELRLINLKMMKTQKSEHDHTIILDYLKDIAYITVFLSLSLSFSLLGWESHIGQPRLELPMKQDYLEYLILLPLPPEC